MGLLEALNPSISANPFYSALNSRRGAISGLGAALGTGTLSGMGQYMPMYMQNGMMIDQQTAERLAAQKAAEEEQARLEQQRQQAVDYLSGAGAGELSRGVELGMIDPQAAFMANYERMNAQPQQTEYDYMDVNGNLVATNPYDPNDVRTVFSAPQEAWQTLTPDEMAQLGIPNSGQIIQRDVATGQLRAVGGGGTTVTVNNQGSSTYQNQIDKSYADRDIQIYDAAQTAQSALTNFDVMDRAMSDPNFYSGAGGDAVLQLKRFASLMGMDATGVENMETFNAISKAAALDVMGGSLGTGFSNADRDFVMDQVPTLGNTPQGNRTLIDIQRRIAERKIEIAQWADEYKAMNNGQLNGGWPEFLRQKAEQNPIFPRNANQPRQGGLVIDYTEYFR